MPEFAVQHSYLIPLLPLIGAIIAGFFGARFLKQQSHWPIWIGVGASALITFVILFIVLNHSGHRAAAHATAGHPIDQGTLDHERADIASRNTSVSRGVLKDAERVINHLRQADEGLRSVLKELSQRD